MVSPLSHTVSKCCEHGAHVYHFLQHLVEGVVGASNGESATSLNSYMAYPLSSW